MVVYDTNAAKMLAQVEPEATRLRKQIEEGVEELSNLFLERAAVRSDRADYIGRGSPGGGQRTPQALAEVELTVGMNVPTQEAGKNIPQGRREAMIQAACRESEDWKQVKGQCDRTQARLDQLDARVEGVRIRINGSQSVLAYYSSLLQYLGGIEGAVRF